MSKTILKVVSWSEAGKANMAPQKRAEISAFYKKYDGKNIEVVFRVLPRRSIQSNRYYWGCVIPTLTEAMNELGNSFTHEGCHEFCKKRFNPKEVIGVGGEVIDTIPGSSAELNNEEFHEDYIEKIKQFAAEYLSVVIADPNQQVELFKSEK